MMGAENVTEGIMQIYCKIKFKARFTVNFNAMDATSVEKINELKYYHFYLDKPEADKLPIDPSSLFQASDFLSAFPWGQLKSKKSREGHQLTKGSTPSKLILYLSTFYLCKFHPNCV